MPIYDACQSYRAGHDICSDGFFQTAICSGRVGCFSCGHVSDLATPNCQRDDYGDNHPHWTESGAPRFYPVVAAPKPNKEG